MNRQRRIQVLAGALCAIALVAIITVLSGGAIDESSVRLLASVFITAIYVVLALPGERLFHTGEPWSWFGAVSLFFCAVGALAAVWLIWDVNFNDEGGGDDSEGLWKVAGICLLYSVTTAHGSSLVREISERDTAGTVARYATLILALSLATIFSDALMNEDDPAMDPKVLAVLGILYALGTVVSPLLKSGETKREAAEY
jgi:hypothetical protein